ncbi:serine protease 33-like [Styela clava]
MTMMFSSPVAVLRKLKISVVYLMLYGFLLNGIVCHPTEEFDYNLSDDMIVALNEYTECGVQNEDFFSAKFRSTEPSDNKSVGRWPWMAYVYEKRDDKMSTQICGGTLIDSQHIVTAAHCVEYYNEPDKYGLILGDNTTIIYSESEKLLGVSSVLRHDNYNETTLDNDIALLQLKNRVIFSENVRPACLPPQGLQIDETDLAFYSESQAGKQCTVLAMKQSEQIWPETNIIHELQVPILPRLLCTSITGGKNASEYANRMIHENSRKFCAGGIAGEDSCYGDGGAPLLCRDDTGKYILHGITSYGPSPCGQENLPGVYTQVSEYREWIEMHRK